MVNNKPAEGELNSTKNLNSMFSRIFLVREGDKKDHVSCADNSVVHIIIKSIRTNIAVTRKLPIIANHNRCCPFNCSKHLLFCNNFIFAKLAKETKGFLKV